MTQQQRKAAQKRAQLREDDSIWWLIMLVMGITVLFSLVGWMVWDEPQQINVTQPVNIERAVQSGGLVVEE